MAARSVSYCTFAKSRSSLSKKVNILYTMKSLKIPHRNKTVKFNIKEMIYL